MDKKDKIWIKSMELFAKYWGCHQMPERSFYIFKYQLPICARCTGMIVGYIVSFVMILIGIRFEILICLLLMMPMVADGGIQYLTSYVSNNLKRFFTGFLFSIGFLFILFLSIKLII